MKSDKMLDVLKLLDKLVQYKRLLRVLDVYRIEDSNLYEYAREHIKQYEIELLNSVSSEINEKLAVYITLSYDMFELNGLQRIIDLMYAHCYLADKKKLDLDVKELRKEVDVLLEEIDNNAINAMIKLLFKRLK